MNSRYRITINKRGFIPGVGNGPIKRPITVSKAVYENLTKLGYDITIVEDPILKAKEITSKIVSEIVTPPVEPKVDVVVVDNDIQDIIDNEDVVDADPIVETTPIVETEEVVDEVEETEEVVDEVEETEEVVVDDKDLSAEAFYNEAFLTSKNMCKKILDARAVQYDNDASFTVLKRLVSESNPDVVVG